MRFHWIRDQVRQGVFDIYWREEANNLADFYTKALAMLLCPILLLLHRN